MLGHRPGLGETEGNETPAALLGSVRSNEEASQGPAAWHSQGAGAASPRVRLKSGECAEDRLHLQMGRAEKTAAEGPPGGEGEMERHEEL